MAIWFRKHHNRPSKPRAVTNFTELQGAKLMRQGGPALLRGQGGRTGKQDGENGVATKWGKSMENTISNGVP